MNQASPLRIHEGEDNLQQWVPKGKGVTEREESISHGVPVPGAQM
jgi:hypothetical protein